MSGTLDFLLGGKTVKSRRIVEFSMSRGDTSGLTIQTITIDVDAANSVFVPHSSFTWHTYEGCRVNNGVPYVEILSNTSIRASCYLYGISGYTALAKIAGELVEFE